MGRVDGSRRTVLEPPRRRSDFPVRLDGGIRVWVGRHVVRTRLTLTVRLRVWAGA